MVLTCLLQRLFVAEEGCQLAICSTQQLREERPRNMIVLSDVCHFSVDALIEPRQVDHLDTGVGISIRTSDTLHRVASGWWWVVTTHHDSLLISLSYHRQGFR